jgi:hypothetical protein
MSRFTEGPWHISQNRSSVGVYNASGNPVCKLPAAQFTMPRKLADARLIAAAPELYKALEGLLARSATLDQSATHDGLQNCEALAAARAALARARGEA